MRKQPMMYQWSALKNQNQFRTYKTYTETREDILLDEIVEPDDVVVCVDFQKYGNRHLCLTKFGMAYVFLVGWDSI